MLIIISATSLRRGRTRVALHPNLLCTAIALHCATLYRTKLVFSGVFRSFRDLGSQKFGSIYATGAVRRLCICLHLQLETTSKSCPCESCYHVSCILYTKAYFQASQCYFELALTRLEDSKRDSWRHASPPHSTYKPFATRSRRIFETLDQLLP